MNRRHLHPRAPRWRCAARRRAAPPRSAFEPTRFSVEVRGRGPDVILIPGLTAGRERLARHGRARCPAIATI